MAPRKGRRNETFEREDVSKFTRQIARFGKFETVRKTLMHDTSSPRIVKLVRSDGGDLGNPLTIAFISDLHLLSSRHDYARHAASVRRAIESCDVCIWGGDLFDFHWSCEGD